MSGAAGTSGSAITEEGATIDSAATEEEDTTYTCDETTVCALTPNDTVTVDISIDELDIRSIVVGMPVTVTLDALPGQSFDGKVTALYPFGTNSGGNTKYTVTVTMNKQESMLLGMNASVTINLQKYTDVLLIPESSLIEESGKSYVYTSYDEGKDELGELVEVETGRADGTNVEILSGLEADQICYYRYAGTITYVFEE